MLGSFKQAQARVDLGAMREEASTGSSAAVQGCVSRNYEEVLPASEPDYPGRPEPAKLTETPNRRTWWGSTRQILWLMILLLACIIFFRVFGPERKKTNIEDFFRPGDQDIEFLEAIEFLEKYYEKKRKQKSGIADFEVGETLPADTQPAHVPDAEPETPAGQAPDTAATPARNAPSPASKGPQP